MKNRFIFLCLLSFCLLNASQNSVKIINKTEKDLYVAVYYVYKDATKATAIYTIEPDSTIKIQRPERKKRIIAHYYDRDAFFTFDKNELKESLTQAETQGMKRYNIADSSFKGFSREITVIIKSDGRLGAYYAWESSKIEEALLSTKNKALEVLLTPIRKAFSSSPYADKKADVYTRAEVLNNEEEDYLKKRFPLTKKTIETLIGKKIEDRQVPRIAFCCSGGGYRAMTATLGDFLGANAIGLIDATTYVVGLSGSTWAIAGWTTSGMNIGDYLTQLSKRINTDLFKNSSITKVADALLTKKAFGEPVSLIDIYGTLLGQKILKGLDNQQDPNKIHLTQQIERIKDGSRPFPIYTAIIAPDRAQDDYEWVEFTPYQVGSPYLTSYVDTWATGEKFKAGTSIHGAPPLPLGYFMGIWGSAFSENLRASLEEYISKLPKVVASLMSKAVADENVGDTRISPAHIWNLTFGMEGKPLSYKKKLTLVDGGLDFNDPLPPLLRPSRKVDIIIVLDQSATVENAPEFKKAEDYCRKRKIPFPTINYKTTAKTCSVYSEPTEIAPTIIFMPRVGNDSGLADYQDILYMKGNWAFTQTTNFAYSEAQVNKLSGLTKDNMIRSKEIIIQTIKDFVDKKK